MEAKDMVMSEDEAYTAIRPYWVKSTVCKECGTVKEGLHLLTPSERDSEIAKAQAEMTWGKAIKEVVDWVNEQIAEMDRTGYYPKREMWQAKLKEWGIDEIRG